MLATLATKAFDDPDWLFEIKWDGFRVQAAVDGGKARILTRNLHDAAAYFPTLLANPSRWIEAEQAIIDGEVVALDDNGVPDFSLLQTKLGDKQATGLAYQAFDLLYLDGRSLLDVPLEDRKRLLRSVLKDHPRVRYAAHVEGEGLAFFEAAKQLGVEGMVAKLRRSRYEPGRRSSAWLKIKIRPEQELVVGGWTPGSGNARDLGAVAVGCLRGRPAALRGQGRVGLLGRHPQGPAGQARGAGDRTHHRSIRRRPRTTAVAGAGTWSASAGCGRSSSSGPRSVAGRATGRCARRPTRASSRTVTPRTSCARPRSPRPPRSVPPRRRSPPNRAKMTPCLDRRRVRRRAKTAGGVARRRRCRTSAAQAGRKAGHRRPRPLGRRNPAFAAATEAELAALDAIAKEGVWSVGGYELKLTNLEKPLFDGRGGHDGEQPITKRELIRYFARIAPTMLPHLADRPLNMQRFPNGAGAPGFWQKNLPETAPKFLTRWHETGVDGRTDRNANEHLVPDKTAALCWLGQQGSFEVHAWTGKLPDAWEPTFAYIDIDPGEKTTWEETLVLARLYRTALGHLGVRGYPKTTGKRGIQVWIPIEQGRYDFSRHVAWVERVSRAVGSTVPELISWEWAKEARKGRARLDYTQNASIKTLVAPYSVRPAAGAPVSTPITWDELDDPDLRPDRWTVRTILDRVGEVGDLFAAAQTDAQELPPV